jgi:hypothetical protein
VYRAKNGSGHKNSKITFGRSCARHGRRTDAKETLVCNNKCKKKVGRPKPGWLDEVNGDTKKLRVMMSWRRILD